MRRNETKWEEPEMSEANSGAGIVKWGGVGGHGNLQTIAEELQGMESIFPVERKLNSHFPGLLLTGLFLHPRSIVVVGHYQKNLYTSTKNLQSMITVAIGGTFDILHKGHEALLEKAFELGDLIYLGLTTDEFANLSRERKVRPFEIRRQALLALVKSMDQHKKFTIVPLRDTFGLTLEKDLDYLVVSPETVRMADKINYIREQEGRPKIRIVVVDHVLAKDGKPISSTRVGNREIDPDGNIETVFTEGIFPSSLLSELKRKEGGTPVLVHVCCAPCLSYPLGSVFRDHTPIGYFYNPNIQPFQEYRRRLEGVKEFSSRKGLRAIYRDEYDPTRFMEGVAGTGYEREDRCRWCYHDRLETTARAAKKLGIGCFTTSLLSSPHQLHDLVREVGETVAKTHALDFLYYDTRDHYREGVEEARDLDLYVQNYCGCIFSESDRFRKKLVGQPVPAPPFE